MHELLELLKTMPDFIPRQPSAYMPEGYFDSDNDTIADNPEAVTWFLDNAPEIKRLVELAST
jgi:hypothetical protein